MADQLKRSPTQPCLHGRKRPPNFNSTLAWYSLLLFLSVPTSTLAQSCALYEPPVPGLTCLRGGKALNAVTDSRTSWVVEFYSSWCGHCQHFAPAMKDLGKEVRPWDSVIRIGVLECTESKENQDICSKFDVQAYPTLRFFKPNDRTPLEYKNKIVGARTVEAVKRLIVDHVTALSEKPDNWPDLRPLQDDSLLSIPAADWKPTVLIFDDDTSYIGKELILDLSSSKTVIIHRVSTANTALILHYSVLEFPTMVVEFEKDDFHVIAGHSFENPRKKFHEALISHLNQFKVKRKQDKKLHAPAHASQAPPPGLHPSSPKVAELGKVSAPAVQKPLTPPPSSTRINRVHLDDLLSAVSYALRREVSIHNIISGSAFSALTRFIRLLESAFSLTLPAASEVMGQVRTKVESRASTGFIINRDWQRVLETRLDAQLFPEEPRWKYCNGSLPRYRGYPCGLWMLMHTVTILTLPTHSSLDGAFTSKEALLILSAFVRNFFSCEVCRVHFTEMALTINQGGITHDGDAVVWLWEAHNVVNKRLKGSISSDPAYPKVMFPSYQVCPYCYKQGTSTRGVMNDTRKAVSLTINHPGFNDTKFSKGESLVSAFMNGNTNVAVAMDKNAESAKHVWNRTAVLLYLWNFYHLAGNKSGRGHRHVSSRRVLHAAWPKLYKNVDRLHHKFYGLGKGGMHYSDHSGLGFNHVDTGICLMSYVMCVLFLAVIAYLLLRRRRLRRLFL